MKIKLKDLREIAYSDPLKEGHSLRYDLRFNQDYILTVIKDLPDKHTKEDLKKIRVEVVHDINEKLEPYGEVEINSIELPDDYIAPSFLNGV